MCSKSIKFDWNIFSAAEKLMLISFLSGESLASLRLSFESLKRFFFSVCWLKKNQKFFMKI